MDTKVEPDVAVALVKRFMLPMLKYNYCDLARKGVRAHEVFFEKVDLPPLNGDHMIWYHAMNDTVRDRLESWTDSLPMDRYLRDVSVANYDDELLMTGVIYKEVEE